MSIEEQQSPITSTQHGLVLGRQKKGVLLFNGIPYAEPPVGDRRFKRPVSPASWDDIRDATRFGPAAPQLPSGGMTDSVPVNWNEDCLFLNVCTPAIDQKKRPVLVWIHGGAYRSGQGAVPWYNGTSFALNGDIVVVSINYRLGALGFTDLSRFGDDYATSGINGICDQIKALEWVRDNISGFGGDPSKVTIAGESAGGFSVATLLGCEQAQGLFRRAIPQSGATHHTLTDDVGKVVADLLMDELGVESIDELKSASVLDILEAQARVDVRYNQMNIGNGVQAFYPVEQNEVLPMPLRESIRAGVGATVPVLIGTNKDENTLFVTEKMSSEKLRYQAKAYGRESLVEAYREMLPGATETDLAIELGTDFTFKIPAIRLAEDRVARGADTWMYQFDWESRNAHLKATHALEIPFVFNTLTSSGVDAFIGEGELPQAVSDEMHGVWTSFIQGDEPGWPKYDLEKRTVKHFDNNSSLVDNGELPRLNAWEGIR
jgi:para-nitrobenzyl esterase